MAAVAAAAVVLFAPDNALAGDTVRIALVRHVTSAVLASEAGLTVRPTSDVDPARSVVLPDVATVLDVRAESGRLVIANSIEVGTKVLIASPFGLPIDVNGAPYRGSIVVQLDPDGALTVVDFVDLEQYLYGVVGSEMPASWPTAALEAQAIVARTYAVGRLGIRDDVGYDLVAGDQDQAYGGVDSESPSTILAADATRGEILVYGGQIVHTYYSADDGGFTADGSALSDPQPYLKAKPDPYALGSPDNEWSATIPAADLAQSVDAYYTNVGDVTGIESGPTDESGRLESISIFGTLGSATLSGFDFRRLAGRRTVRSTRISAVALEGSRIRVSGSGFGHGVGLSQWGARSMAASGIDCLGILRFYYSGTALTTIADGPAYAAPPVLGP
ncbi:MAG TPA: SpoIID/LytB domain-containing protein [Candidatus Eremiobacteraceae bacterium]|nr:SpoIID/LytB domain-containing protein [Candidatus Eremiobacteraceae bacterium]